MRPPSQGDGENLDLCLHHPEMEAAWAFEKLVSYQNCTWHHNPEELD